MAPGHASARAHRQNDRLAGRAPDAASRAPAPKIIFSSIDAPIARELEPKFAAAGCAVVSNSSAFRMAPNVPLVLPEVNADHLHLIEEQSWRKESGGYIVTNSNCTVMGPVLALKPHRRPLRNRADLRHIHAGCQRRGLSRRGVDGHSRQRRPLHPQRRREDGRRDAQAAGLTRWPCGQAARRAHERQLQSRPGRRRPHRQRLHQARQAGYARRDSGRVGGVSSARRAESAHRSRAAHRVGAAARIARSRAWTAIAATAWP